MRHPRSPLVLEERVGSRNHLGTSGNLYWKLIPNWCLALEARLYPAKYRSLFVTKYRQTYRRLRTRLYHQLHRQLHRELNLALYLDLDASLYRVFFAKSYKS
jgi:hypothetical protein